jgi:hypothetical protein
MADGGLILMTGSIAGKLIADGGTAQIQNVGSSHWSLHVTFNV